MPLPSFDNNGELPLGLYQATLGEIIAEFGGGAPQRQGVTERLLRIYELVKATGKLERVIIFGSYITNKPEPNDVDIFLVMAEEFEVTAYAGEARIIFSQMQAQDYFGASIFWVTRGTSLTGIDDLISGWQTKRDKTKRGIVEII
jgi:predicted nucleotidyltransferase